MSDVAFVTTDDDEFEHLRAELSKLGVAVVTQPRAETTILVPFVQDKVDAAAMDRQPGLRLIATRSTGVDHIDLAAAEQRGIAVRNVADYGSVAVAEHVFALMLRLTHPQGHIGTDLSGKTLGVVGTGAIGRHVIGIAHGFGMNVLAYDREQKPGITYAGDLDDLLAQSDIVTLHVPGTPSTRHMINAERLRQMRTGAYLINTARGSLVDTEALRDALLSGKLAGAGLDVVDWPHDDALPLPHTIITPHAAYNTREAVRRITDVTIKNIRDFLEYG